MSGHCDECGNTICICEQIAAEASEVVDADRLRYEVRRDRNVDPRSHSTMREKILTLADTNEWRRWQLIEQLELRGWMGSKANLSETLAQLRRDKLIELDHGVYRFTPEALRHDTQNPDSGDRS